MYQMFWDEYPTLKITTDTQTDEFKYPVSGEEDDWPCIIWDDKLMHEIE